ncbi:hypothetical protein [Clostridium sp. JN-9]|uniref:hypothetical protein n=1 Tax=Clostridium sp. JN-9 TaxID=2507159 RepID=UPI000FFE1E2E|nr:hypothetical protein [Clostridium sp. JN-9]QAT40655.1 hypothetical protein EQM05_10480 [Clostridium sp. JN-9]
MKYGARALVYRALKDEKAEPANLKEFMKDIEDENIEGIVDLKRLQEDNSKREFYLRTAINFLKEMVSFHIEAAKRTRYEKAAYYCSVIKDTLTLLKQSEEFNTYYDNLINVNRRRPALKDEMKKGLVDKFIFLFDNF